MDLTEVRRRLEERQRQIEARVRRIEGDLRRPGDRDWQEQASEAENDEVLEGLDDRERGELEQIARALRRIESGDYERCAECGEPIGERRLVALPTATLCVDCAD